MKETRTCKICLQNKDISSFERTTKKNGKSYYRHFCKTCKNKKDYVAVRNSDEKYEKKKKRNRQQRYDPKLRYRYIMSDCQTYDTKFGFENDLDADFVEKIISKGCSYCKCKRENSDIQIGLDRIDNSKGHTKNNVNSCCSRCNFIRRNIPYPAWEKLVPVIQDITQSGLLDGWCYGFKTHFKHTADD